MIEQTIPALLLILVIGLFIPDLFKKRKMPFVTSIILLAVITTILSPILIGFINKQ